MKKHTKYKPMTLAELEKKFPHEKACKSYLAARRWPSQVSCPRCGSIDEVYELQSQEFKWECMACAQGNAYRFSVLVGTIFENTNVDLTIWFKVIYLMLVSKKGISALQVQRMMGLGSYRTAWSMCHRIRVALGKRDFQQLVGFVEVDETFVGGKARNKHKGPGGRGGMGGTGGSGKTIVAGAVQRKGNVVARVVNSTDSNTLSAFVREVVSHKVSLLCADEHRGYNPLKANIRSASFTIAETSTLSARSTRTP
jgi:transposase-like protein